MNILDKVRKTCDAFQSPLAWCDHSQARIFAESIDPTVVLSFVHSSEGLSTNRFDSEISFPTPADEIGFILVAHGLDFGSGFRYLLHDARNGQGAWLTIRAGLVRMGQMNSTCDAIWLVSLSVDDIQKLFDLEATSLYPLAEQLHASVHEIGSQLLALGYHNPGEFVMKHMTHSAVNAVSTIVETFPLTFKDEYMVGGQEVCLYKKAQLVVSEMNLLFGTRFPTKFDYPDINELTSFVDNVVVAMLRMHQVVCCADDLSERITQGVYLLKGSEEEVALRSAALTGVEVVVRELAEIRAMRGDTSEAINAQKLCNWLWGCVGKDGPNRKYPRHLSPSTSFY